MLDICVVDSVVIIELKLQKNHDASDTTTHTSPSYYILSKNDCISTKGNRMEVAQNYYLSIIPYYSHDYIVNIGSPGMPIILNNTAYQIWFEGNIYHSREIQGNYYLGKVWSNIDIKYWEEKCDTMYNWFDILWFWQDQYFNLFFEYPDSVDKALSKLSNRAVSLRESNREEIKAIEKNIVELRRTINEAIEKEYNNSSIPENTPLPEEASMTLGLDRATLYSSIVGNTKNYMDHELRGWFLGLFGRVKVKDRDKDNVRDMINSAIDDYTDKFLTQRQILLESQRDIFMEVVKQTIMDNGNISAAAKKFFLDVPVPQVVKPGITNWGELYDSHCRTEKFLMFKGEYLDKVGFIQDVEKMLVAIADSMLTDYSKDYRDSLESLLQQIKSQFEGNLDTYSLYMKAMVENRDAMKELGDKVADVATELFDCQKQLNDIIWNLRLTSFWL